MRFWDSSAVVPLCYAEPKTQQMRELLAADTDVVLWALTPAEVTSALWRRHRTHEVTADAVHMALRTLNELEQVAARVVDLQRVEQRARRLLALHPLTAADALQLAAALVVTAEQPSLVPVVTLDQRLADACRREGFEVLC